PPHTSPLFPYTTLFRSGTAQPAIPGQSAFPVQHAQFAERAGADRAHRGGRTDDPDDFHLLPAEPGGRSDIGYAAVGGIRIAAALDRKSTRLNSSHVKIS